MGFGLKVEAPKAEVPKAAAPKVEAPKLAVAGIAGAASAVGGAAAGAAGGVKGAVAGAAAGVGGAAAGLKSGVGGAVEAAGGAALSLSAVAGALAEVSVSFQGGTEDAAMEPHMVLDANAGFEETKFEKGPVWVRVDLPPDLAKASTDTLHLYCASGAYDKREKISAFKEQAGTTVDVEFADAPMDQEFSLDVIDDQGRAHAIFAHVSYGDMRKTNNRY
jgi:hypothetical protein